jgi:integrase
MHDLRHTAITHLIRAGADVGQVARFAGHARPSMTLDKYLHEFEARKGNDVAARLGQAFADVL